MFLYIMLYHPIPSRCRGGMHRHLSKGLKLRLWHSRLVLQFTGMQSLVIIILLLTASLFHVVAEEDPIPLQTCFDFTGRPLTNNTQCPGSNACCHYLHQCTGNLLCTQPGSDLFVNALCAVNPWKNCSNICQYGKT